MRWSNLTIAEEERARLPGYSDEAVVRRFDAPEALSTRFYEVRAKSILNRVPDASQMPFRWTINPYRGCTHACSYCAWGGTPILTGDGRHKPLAELDIGEAVYGTVTQGRHRRYALTTVVDKWITLKPAFRVITEGGTELILSGEHRLLTDRGWKHVAKSDRGMRDRPHLTNSNHLVGTGAFAPQPAHNAEYRRGYLCAMIRGDGHRGTDADARGGGSVSRAHRPRLARADLEPLERSREFLQRCGIDLRERVIAIATETHREVNPVSCHRRSPVEQIRGMIEWPGLPTLDWCRGFLAGSFDAAGSRSALALRIHTTSPQILGWTEACAHRLGFPTARDRSGAANGLEGIRIEGGLTEHLRFFHLTDPAMTRKRSIDGQMVKTFENLRIVSIEPLGTDLPLYDITTGTGDFIANGVVSHNCFARPTHTYLDFDAGRDFEREIVVKVNAPERLRVELARPSWRGEHIALGTNTDPYQWVEGRYRLMRGIWEAMIEAGNPGSVLTKSPLLLRDLDLMVRLSERADFSAALSVPTLDEKAWRATEPHTPHPRARLEAVAELVRAGIPTGVLIAPLMPGINDAPEQLEPILALAAEAGASYVTGIALHLRRDVRKLFFAWLAEHRPDLVSRYRELYRNGAYASTRERRRLARLVQGPEPSPWQRGAGGAIAAPEPAAADPGHHQESLFEAG